MKLLARVSIYRHEIDEARDYAARQRGSRTLAIFRVVGGTPTEALKLLASSVPAAGEEVSVALTVEGSDGLNAAQARVCEAVIARCRSLHLDVLLCGLDADAAPGSYADSILSGFKTNKVFPTVADMVQRLGSGEPRAASPRQAETAVAG